MSLISETVRLGRYISRPRVFCNQISTISIFREPRPRLPFRAKMGEARRGSRTNRGFGEANRI